MAVSSAAGTPCRFYGYPFTKLASEVRLAVATAVNEQIGVSVLPLMFTLTALFSQEQA